MRSTSTVVFFLLGVVVILLWGCVDVPTEGQAPPDYHALARFVNAATDAAAGPVSVDGAQVTSLSFGDASSYFDFQAGGRNADFASLTQKITLRSQSQNTVIIYALTSGNRFLVLDEGYNFVNNGISGVTRVRFVHAGQGSAPTIYFLDSSATGTPLATGVPYITAQDYTSLTPGAHTIYAVSDGGYNVTIDGSQATPPTSSLTTGSGTCTLTPADGLTWSFDVTTSFRDSFYTAAHFHFGAPGVAGPIVEAIDVSPQTITFPTATISGLNAVPPEPSIVASGSGTFTLTHDGLVYSVALTIGGDTVNTEFTGGEFRNAAATSNGPTVRTLLTGNSMDTTITGTWTATDAQPLTNALITQLLDGNIYVAFHTNRNPSGEIRAQLVPDSFTTTTYSGSWAAIPDSVKDSIVAGHVYANFHTLRVPGGIVRGQLVVDPARGQYGVASLPAADYGDGRMYTVVASGSGFTFGLHQYSDRQLGLTKNSVSSIPYTKKP